MTSIRSGLTSHLHQFTQSRVQVVVAAMGLWWVSNGPLGLIIGGLTFAVPAQPAQTVWVLFVPVNVNAWHAVFHMLTGLIGLAAARRRETALIYAVAMAVVYLMFGALGLCHGANVVLGVMAVDTFGSWVHLTEATILIIGAAITLLTVTGGVDDHRDRSPNARLG